MLDVGLENVSFSTFGKQFADQANEPNRVLIFSRALNKCFVPPFISILEIMLDKEIRAWLFCDLQDVAVSARIS